VRLYLPLHRILLPHHCLGHLLPLHLPCWRHPSPLAPLLALFVALCYARMTGEVMEEPQPPEPGECCGSGCSPCVWDLYYEKLEKYEAWKAKQEQIANDKNENEENKEQPKQIEETAKITAEEPKEIENTHSTSTTPVTTPVTTTEQTEQPKQVEPTSRSENQTTPSPPPQAQPQIQTNNNNTHKWMVYIAPCTFVVFAFVVGLYINAKR
jgi:cell division septation protein DedD